MAQSLSSSSRMRSRSRSGSRIDTSQWCDADATLLNIPRPYEDTAEYAWVTLALDILPFWDDVMNQDKVGTYYVDAATRKEWSRYGQTRHHGDAGNKIYEIVVLVGLGLHHKLMSVDAEIDYGPEGKRKLKPLEKVQEVNREHMGDILESIMGLAYAEKEYGSEYEGFEDYSNIVEQLVDEVHHLWTHSEKLMENNCKTKEEMIEMLDAVVKHKPFDWYTLQFHKAHQAKLAQIASSSQSQTG